MHLMFVYDIVSHFSSFTCCRTYNINDISLSYILIGNPNPIMIEMIQVAAVFKPMTDEMKKDVYHKETSY